MHQKLCPILSLYDLCSESCLPSLCRLWSRLLISGSLPKWLMIVCNLHLMLIPCYTSGIYTYALLVGASIASALVCVVGTHSMSANIAGRIRIDFCQKHIALNKRRIRRKATNGCAIASIRHHNEYQCLANISDKWHPTDANGEYERIVNPRYE